MGRNGNGLHGNGREWEYEKPFPVISSMYVKMNSESAVRYSKNLTNMTIQGHLESLERRQGTK